MQASNEAALRRMLVEATGRDVRFRVTGIARFEDGGLAEIWLDVDWLTLFQQRGGVPPALIGQ